MFTEAIDAVITDGSFITDYVSVFAGISQIKMPVCGALATDPALADAEKYPYLSLMRTTDTDAARAMCNLVVSYGWAAAGLVRHAARRTTARATPEPPLPS